MGTAVLGEIPDQDAALAELARRPKPDGRVVVGELLGDPHWVSPGRLRDRATTAASVRRTPANAEGLPQEPLGTVVGRPRSAGQRQLAPGL